MGNFKKIETGIEGLVLIEHLVFEDNRGFFIESYHKEEFSKIGLEMDFVQDNHSKSTKGVLRGLHFQVNNPQGKLVRVIKGEVFDVGVDLRPDSPTYKKWHGVLLSENDNKLFYVPEGFAHGFLVLSDEAEFQYKCTNYYSPNDECGIIWNDSDINIDWPLDLVDEVKLSGKDQLLTKLSEVEK